MATISKQFQRCSFKGVEFDALNWGVGFSHDLAEHKFLFRDERFIQPQGRTNMTWRASVVMSQNHPNMLLDYVKTFPAMFAACTDGEPGDLITPDLGTFRAACASLSYEIKPSMKDGVVVDIDWVKAPELADLEGASVAITPTVQSAANLAESLAKQYADSGFTEEEESPDPPLTSIFNVIQGVNDQIMFGIDSITARIDSAIFTAKRMENIVAGKKNGERFWGLEAELRRLQLEMHQAKRTVGGAGNQPARSRVNSETTIDELARDLQVTVESLFALNPDLAALQLIPSGTVVRFVPGR